MKTKAPLLILLCCFHFIGAAQTVNELYNQLAKAKNTRSQIDITNSISYELRTVDPDSAIALANHSLQLAHDENYEHGEGTALLCLSYANITKAKYELSYDYAKKAKIIADRIKNDSLAAYSLLGIAVYNYNTSRYDDAIETAIKALKLFETAKIPLGIVKTKSMMSQVYQLKNDLPHAEALLQENMAQFDKINDLKVKVNILHTLANVYGMQEKYDKALELDKQGIEMCKADNMLFFQSQFYDNMANCYMYSQRYTEAKKYFLKSLAIDSSFGNAKQMSDTYLNMGNLLLLQKKYEEAKADLKRAVLLADSSGYKQGKYQSLLLLSDAYKQNNEANAAIEVLREAYTVKDSVINEKSESKIAELETVFQAEKKEQQLKLQQAAITKKNFLLTGLLIVVGLLSFAGFMFYRKKQVQNKLHLQTAVMEQQNIATKAILGAEENERRRIAADLHDGVGQLMSAAKMNLSAFESELTFKNTEQKYAFEKIISLVDESCREVRNVSHQMMPNALLKSGLASAVREFIDKIDDRVLKVTLHTEGLNERLDNNVETVLYRVIQECVNNVIKHAAANSLDISLIKDTDGISATIEDNGKGFSIKNKEEIEGIGLKNILSRVQFLKGTVEFDSSPGKGTLVAIHVPLV